MKSMQKIWLGFLLCAIVFTVSSALSTISIFFPSWFDSSLSGCGGYDSAPSIYATCETSGATSKVKIEVTNYGTEEIPRIDCKLTDKGGLVSSEDLETLTNLGSQSTDICVFDLDGNSTTQVRFEIGYSGKTIKQVVTCTPSISDILSDSYPSSFC